jgi:DNA repair and recombination RAD54-like protein
MSKEGLQKVIQQEQTDNKMQVHVLGVSFTFFLTLLGAKYIDFSSYFLQGSSLSTEDLRDLFTFHEQVRLNLFL